MDRRRALSLCPFVVAMAACRPPSPHKPTDSALPIADTDTGLPATDTDSDPPDTDPPDDTALPSNDPGDTPADARALPSPSPALQVSDVIDPAGDVDWFAVELDAGDTLWIAVLSELRTPPSPLSPLLEVRTPDGRTHLARGMPLGIGGDNAALAYEATEAGVHHIGVMAAHPDRPDSTRDPTIGSPEHAYSLRLEQAPPFEREPHNDTPAQMGEWLEEDDTYAFFGDPYIAGYPLFSGRADHTDDIDLLPWTVRGEHADGSPAAWELWSWSPWPGSATTARWTVQLQPDGSDDLLLLGQADRPTTDPMWQLARGGLPLFPDVGLLVAAQAGEMWLELDHADGPTGTGTAYTGVLAGWYTDAIDRDSDLPTDSSGRLLPSVHVTEAARICTIQGRLEDHEIDDVYSIAVDPDRPWVQVFIQAASVGSPLDPRLTVEGADGPLASASDSVLDASEDPELLDIDAAGSPTIALRVEAEGVDGGAYLLQVHAMAEPHFR